MSACENCERCTWNAGPDCGRVEHPHCERCGHCVGRHNRAIARTVNELAPRPVCPDCSGRLTAPMPATMGMIYVICDDCDHGFIFTPLDVV